MELLIKMIWKVLTTWCVFIMVSHQSFAASQEKQICQLKYSENQQAPWYVEVMMRGKKYSISQGGFFLNYLPLKKIDRLPLTIVELNTGYIWQGFHQEHRMGLYYYDNSLQEDILIKKGHVVAVFELDGEAMVIENQSNEGKEWSSLSKLSSLDFTMSVEKTFDGPISWIWTESDVIHQNAKTKGVTYLLAGSSGWVYRISSTLEDGYLECFEKAPS
ncbi:hypothetical protein E2K93_14985 [Thalassotalea sp. HSM 43]|uniref:hypothetical protein n=1 Tax=Thalassotalea sp. HSM 43 TaxID=2552945 RepID=UPI0010822312|nr:hypothetical protein [Thalassotalea sp. HSM 43]QBY05594.1 hypothetical protein E2K93_14985 [Thalassotalea sp. HSM 43]